MKNKTSIERSSLVHFGKRVRFFRNARGMSQEELAEIANVHRTYIGMIERGEKNATLLTIIRLANALNITAQEILKGIHNGE